MKQILTILFFLFISGHVARAQAECDSLEASSVEENTMGILSETGFVPLVSAKKISFRVEAGSTIGLSSGNHQIFGIFTAPHISYKISDHWKINAGMRIQHSNFLYSNSPFNPYFPEHTNIFDNNLTQTLLYAESAFYLNPRLLISTSVFKEVSVFDNQSVNPRAFDYDSEGAAVGFNYQLNDHLQFGAEIGFSKNRNPHHYFPGVFGYPSENPFGVRSPALFY